MASCKEAVNSYSFIVVQGGDNRLRISEHKLSRKEEDMSEEIKGGSDSLVNKVKKFVNDNKKGIGIAVGSAVIAGGTVWIIKGGQISSLKKIVSAQANIIGKQLDDIEFYEKLCAAKDAAHLELASDALRHGSSLGASELVEWRKFLKAA